MLVEAGHKLLFKHDYCYSLPEGEEDCYFYCEEL